MNQRSGYDVWRKYLSPHMGKLAGLMVLVLASTGLQLINPQIVRLFIDSTSEMRSTSALIVIALAYIAVAIAAQGASIAATYLGEKVAWKSTNALRGDMVAHALRLDMTFHNQQTPGIMIERIDGDVSVLANFFSHFGVKVVSNFLLLLGMLALLFQVNWMVGVAFIVFTVIAMLVLKKMRNYAVPRWVDTRQSSASLFGFLEERLVGTEDVRSNGATQYVMRRLFELSRIKLGTDKKAYFASGVTWNTTILIFAIGTGMAWSFGAYLFWKGSISLGTVFLIYLYVNMLRTPVEQITQQFRDLQKAQACIQRTQQFLSIESKLVEGPGAELPKTALAVEFDNVWFGYKEDEMVLKGIGFSLGPRQKLGILGRTGSGKSTIAQLLFRFYDVQQGTVRLGGVDAKIATIEQWRRRVAIVTQEVQLFSGTIRDNLTFFNPAISDREILDAFGQLKLLDWLNSLENGLDTQLGAGGEGLSAGQGQLLAFARIYLRDPGLVIFDEASSRLDPATERLLSQAVERLLENRTGIIIAHRLDTIQWVDHVMILDQGEIIEFGKREELKRSDTSRYAQLLRHGMEALLA